MHRDSHSRAGGGPSTQAQGRAPLRCHYPSLVCKLCGHTPLKRLPPPSPARLPTPWGTALLLSSVCVSTRSAFSPEPGGRLRVLPSLLHRGSLSDLLQLSSPVCHLDLSTHVHTPPWRILQVNEGCLHDMGTASRDGEQSFWDRGEGPELAKPQLLPAAQT